MLKDRNLMSSTNATLKTNAQHKNSYIDPKNNCYEKQVYIIIKKLQDKTKKCDFVYLIELVWPRSTLL